MGRVRTSNVTRNIINGRLSTNQPCRFFGARPLVGIDARSGRCCGVLLRSKVRLLLLGPVSAVFEAWCSLRVALWSPVRAGPLSRGAVFRRAALLLFYPGKAIVPSHLYNACPATIRTICETRWEAGFQARCRWALWECVNYWHRTVVCIHVLWCITVGSPWLLPGDISCRIAPYRSCTELRWMDFGTRKTQFLRSCKTVLGCPIWLKLFLWTIETLFLKNINFSWRELINVNC